MSKSPMGRRWFFALAALGVAGLFVQQERPRPTREADAALAEAANHPRANRASLAPAKVNASATDTGTAGANDTVVAATPELSPPAPIEIPRGVLFGFVRPANAAVLDAALPAPARAIHYVQLNHAWLAGKQSPFWQAPGAGRLELPLPDGRALTIAIETSEMLGPDRFASTGRIAGRAASQVVFAYNKGFVHASIDDPELGRFVVRTATDTLAQFYEIDPALVGPCGGERRPVVDAEALLRAAAPRVRQAALAEVAPDAVAPQTAAAENPQRAEIHVLMAYTQAVKADVPGLSPAGRVAALEAECDAAIRKVNEIFAASLISARLKLVRTMETSYSADGAATFVRDLQDRALTALQSSTDNLMDDVHTARDQSGADVVCLLLNRRDSASVGLSYVLDIPGSNANALFAFSIVEYSSLAGTTVFAHELGHVLGCVHDRENATGTGAYPYSYGYRFIGADGRQYHDIMSYPPGTPLSYFSSPNVIVPAPVNAAIGIAAGRPGEADAARTIEQEAFEVASFRLQTQAAANPGRMINVSTRGYIGTGEQVLIGGFVVNSGATKRLFIRASGPSLAAAGVPNLLADPLMRIYSGATPIAFNDNWADAPDAASLGATMALAGAGPVPAPSEAALVLTLPPGPYTAIVEGANGTAGAGIVEIYDVDRTGTKVVNLSTRGFADRNGKELIGGFVVSGAPGTTKRVLVRAMGPTLARSQISNPMEDPFLQLHNAAGQLLIENDDWSTASEGGISVENDFKPLVRYYGEQQIFATGFAPTNRREPCVLLDLAPGAYTAIIKPFEELTDTPPQVAKPGVTLVEVYEIAP